MKFSRVLISLMILCSMASAVPHKSVYRNDDFGIFLHIPPGARLCPYSGTGLNHGAFFLLASQDASICSSYSRQKRGITVFAGYNTAEETKTLHTFLNSWCTYSTEGPIELGEVCSPAPADLSLNDLPSEAARINHSNGWIDVIVVTQAGKPDPDFDASVPSFNYSLRLYTDASHLDADLTVFRAVLRALRLAPPPAGQGLPTPK